MKVNYIKMNIYKEKAYKSNCSFSKTKNNEKKKTTTLTTLN